MTSSDLDKLLLQAQRGDTFAFSTLVENHALQLDLFLRQRASRFVRADFGHEDAFQEVVLKAWTRLESYDVSREEKFSSWLLGVARNVIGDRLRYQRAGKRGPSPDESPRSIPEDLLASATSIASSAIRKEQADRVVAEVESLAGDAKQLFRLIYMEGRSLRDASRRTGITLATASRRVQEAISTLQSRLQP